MKVGTKSVLFGVHQFLIHPLLLAIAWCKLYGFPWDPRLWVAFFVHDLGYIGKPNMDGPEGETHPIFGAIVMTCLFDGALFDRRLPLNVADWMAWTAEWVSPPIGKWGLFTLLHSRYLAKKLGMQPSRLAIADKLVIAIEPSWLYLPRAIASGEIHDYFEQAAKCDPGKGGDFGIDGTREALQQIKDGGNLRDPWLWHRGVRAYMKIWVDRHKDGSPDEMTSATRGN